MTTEDVTRTAEALPEAPAKADVPSLESHAVRGKVTLFDFYAVWCGPCRKLDAHVFALLGQRTDVAVRKLNVVSWETPLAERYMRNVPNLPYVIVYGKSGARLRATGRVAARLAEAHESTRSPSLDQP